MFVFQVCSVQPRNYEFTSSLLFIMTSFSCVVQYFCFLKMNCELLQCFLGIDFLSMFQRNLKEIILTFWRFKSVLVGIMPQNHTGYTSWQFQKLSGRTTFQEENHCIAKKAFSMSFFIPNMHAHTWDECVGIVFPELWTDVLFADLLFWPFA